MTQTNKWLYIATIALFIAPNCVFAFDCKNPQTQTEINRCANSELEAETAAINAAYSNYRIKLNPLEKQQIKEVQLAWIKYRDLSCKFESSPVEQGSMHPYVLAQCLIKQSKVRRQQLEELLRCDSEVSPGCDL